MKNIQNSQEAQQVCQKPYSRHEHCGQRKSGDERCGSGKVEDKRLTICMRHVDANIQQVHHAEHQRGEAQDRGHRNRNDEWRCEV